MANLPISGLTASAANLTATDIMPVVQTTGVGPVKMTGLQLAGGLLGSTALTGATVTTDEPVLDLSQTWNASGVTFTGLRFNAAGTSDANSAAGSLLLDLEVGGVTRFGVTKASTAFVRKDSSNVDFASDSNTVLEIINADATNSNFASLWFRSATTGGFTAAVSARFNSRTGGGIGDLFFTTRITGGTLATRLGVVNGNAVLNGASSFGFASGEPISTSLDTIIRRAAAATLQLGAADTTGTTAPTPQFLRVQSWSSSTNANQAGADFTIQGSRGTGTGAGGSIIFQVAPAGSSGTAQNAYATALTIDSTRLATFAGKVASSFGYSYGNAQFYDASFGPNAGFGVKDITECVVYTQVGSNAAAILGISAAAANGIRINSSTTLGWTSGHALSGAPDTVLARDTNDTLALRRGANAQLFRVYSTYTDGTINAFGGIGAARNLDGSAGDANTLYIGSQKTGAATALTKLAVQVDGTTRLDFNVTAANVWTLGNFNSEVTTNISANNVNSHVLIRQTNNTQSSGSGAFLRLAYDAQATIAAVSRLGGVFFSGTRNGAGNIIDGASVEAIPTQAWVNGSAYGTKVLFRTITSSATALSDKLTIGDTIDVADAINLTTGTTTGTKIGTSTSQKIGFWNATPIVQPTTAVTAATVAATGSGDVVAASTTFDGYTIPQIVKALRNAGLLA